jgi:osmotically inducible protein OsmC
MPARTAQARWEGKLKDGNGNLKLGSGAFEGAYSFESRFQDGTGTNPEELLGAAHAACFSMALSAMLGEAGYDPASVATAAEVSIEEVGGDFKITAIKLRTEGDVPGISAEEFRQQAEKAKAGCPVSKALAGTEIQLAEVNLTSG